MKIFTFVFLLVLAVLCVPDASRASHLIGGEIEYSNVGPNTYLATCKVDYDCRVTIPLDTIQFNLRSPGCNTGITFPSNQQDISNQVLNPYCTNVGNSCSSNSLINLKMVTYS